MCTHFSPKSPRFSIQIIALVTLLCNGCVSFKPAQMNVKEVFYVAVASGESTNYFRVTIKANSILGVAAYESGWFPSSAVDRLYGSGGESDAKTLLNEQKIKGEFDKAYLDAYKNYLKAAKDTSSSDEEIANRLAALKRIRAVPGEGTSLPDGAKEIEYDPVSNLTLRHSGEKFVIAFSSNPNDVLDGIKSAAASNESGAAILRLSELLSQQNQQENAVLSVEKINTQRFAAMLAQRLNSAVETLKSIESKEKTDAPAALAQLKYEVETLLTLVEATL